MGFSGTIRFKQGQYLADHRIPHKPKIFQVIRFSRIREAVMQAFAFPQPYRALFCSRVANCDNQVKILPAELLHGLGLTSMLDADFL